MLVVGCGEQPVKLIPNENPNIVETLGLKLTLHYYGIRVLK